MISMMGKITRHGGVSSTGRAFSRLLFASGLAAYLLRLDKKITKLEQSLKK